MGKFSPIHSLELPIPMQPPASAKLSRSSSAPSKFQMLLRCLTFRKPFLMCFRSLLLCPVSFLIEPFSQFCPLQTHTLAQRHKL